MLQGGEDPNLFHLIDRRSSMSKKLDLKKLSFDQNVREEVTKLHQILTNWEVETQARKETASRELLDEESGWISYEIEKETRRRKTRTKRERSYRR